MTSPANEPVDERIDEILAELFDRGERLGASKWVSNDEKAHAVSEAKAAIRAAIQSALPGKLADDDSGDWRRGVTSGFNAAISEIETKLKEKGLL
jgi:hypothetical protein